MNRIDFATFVGYSVVSRPFLNDNGKYINKPHKERLEVLDWKVTSARCTFTKISFSL